MKKGLVWGAMILICAIQTVKASPLEKIPTDSWVYPIIDRLYTSGLFPELHRSLRPYTRGQIASYLAEIRQKESSGKLQLTTWQNWLIGKLEDEFKYEIKLLQNQEKLNNQAKISTSGVARLTDSKDGPTLGRGQLLITGSWEWQNRVLFQTRGILDNRGEEDPNFFAQEWKKGLTGMFDRGYLGIKAPLFYITLGRDYMRWGPSQQGLLLSSNAPALDFVGFDLGTGKLRFTFFASRLDSITDTISMPGYSRPANRYISGHRLNFKHPAGWEIGFTEMIVYGGVNRPAELYYLNPILPYYVEQFNHDVDDNSLWNLEFAITHWKNKEFYGELLIDDFQYDFKSEPNQLGFVIGTRLADFLGWQGSFWNFQYTQVGTFVYGQQKPWNRYTYQNVVLGHLLGSDFDQWQVSLDYLPVRDFTFTLAGMYQRQGTMTADSVYQNPLPKGVPFPSGIVEKTLTGTAGLKYQPDAHLIASFDFSFQDFKNYRHILDQKHNAWSFRLRLDYNFWKEFWL